MVEGGLICLSTYYFVYYTMEQEKQNENIDYRAEKKQGDMASKVLMGILASLTAFMFYGRINDAAQIQLLLQEKEQAKSERVDIWGKYNVAGKEYMEHMIADAREKEQLKEQILQLDLKETERWMEYWKEKAQTHD